MSINPSIHELIGSQNIEAIKNLLTITITKTRTEGTWAGSWQEAYQTDILSIKNYQAELSLDEIKILAEQFPSLLQNKINMEIALMAAVEAEDLEFTRYLLNICLENSRHFQQPLTYLWFRPILEKVLTKNNLELTSMVFRCPHEWLALAAWNNERNTSLKMTMQDEILASLNEEGAAAKYAKWWVYQLRYLLSQDLVFEHPKISEEMIIGIIRTPEVQECLKHEEWSNSTYLLSKTRNQDILSALFENSKILCDALYLYTSVLNHSHLNWKSLIKKDAHIITALERKIQEKMANPNEAELDSYMAVLHYYLNIPKLNKAEIERLLNLPGILEKFSSYLQSDSNKIYSGHFHYRELLNHEGLLKQFLDLSFNQMKEQMIVLKFDTLFIDDVKTQYQSKASAQEIWAHLHSHLPELKKHLNNLDQILTTRPELKQLFKNLLHLLASLMTLGYHYHQRRRDYGLCFFKSAMIENQVRRQHQHQAMAENYLKP